MNYATAKEIAAAAIPVIDMAPLHEGRRESAQRVAAELLAAAQAVGFFYVRNHGLSADLIARTDALARRFFALPLEEKRKVKVTPWHRGFIQVGEAKMYAGARVDLKESFIWGGEVGAQEAGGEAGQKMRGPSQWPEAVPEMRATFNEYFAAANECGRVLLRGFAASLDLDLDHFSRRFDRPITRGAAVFYPPQPPELGEDQFGVAPHTDYGCLTLVCQDPIGGLQVQGRDGE